MCMLSSLLMTGLIWNCAKIRLTGDSSRPNGSEMASGPFRNRVWVIGRGLPHRQATSVFPLSPWLNKLRKLCWMRLTRQNLLLEQHADLLFWLISFCWGETQDDSYQASFLWGGEGAAGASASLTIGKSKLLANCLSKKRKATSSKKLLAQAAPVSFLKRTKETLVQKTSRVFAKAQFGRIDIAWSFKPTLNRYRQDDREDYAKLRANVAYLYKKLGRRSKDS